MTALLIFLLACAAIYLGAIEAAFSALMRLSLRLLAERSDRPGALAAYLDDPLRLFVPVRLLLGLVTVITTALLLRAIGIANARDLTLSIFSVGAFVVAFEVLIPLVIVARDPERALEVLLPPFRPIATVFAPVSQWTARTSVRRTAPAEEGSAETAAAASGQTNGEPDRSAEGDERRLLQSIVDFGDTLVREVMTPRPDIVAIRDGATVGELRALFREQEYSRFPVFKESLDNIAGFVFVKDLVAMGTVHESGPITPLLRPAVFVPESKRVPELLKQFQGQQTQIAIVVDEYGGTAGLVTIEDLLEELVGEIRDEYDVEAESVVDEGGGSFVFSGKANIDEVVERLAVAIEREGFETVGGYLLTRLGRLPVAGEHVELDGLSIDLLDVERRRINKVRFSRLAPTEVTEEAAARTRA